MADAEKDRDRDLMKKVGDWLDGKQGISGEDELLDQLLQYRNERPSVVTDNELASAWQQLEQKMTPAKVHQIRKNKYAVWRWAVAASVLIAAISGYLLFGISSEPTLLTESAAESSLIILDDGSEVELRPYSRLYRVKKNRNTHTYRLEGEAFFDVTSDPDRRFVVQAADAQVEVLGTRFNVSNWGRSMQVFLEQGSVRLVHTQQAAEVVLKPGQAANALPDGSFVVNPDATVQEYLDWRTNEIFFSEKSLQDIIPELEQHFDVIIRVPESLDQVRLSGNLELSSVVESLRYLAVLLDGRFRKVDDRTYQFTSNVSE